jgi:hypothetical protein
MTNSARFIGGNIRLFRAERGLFFDVLYRNLREHRLQPLHDASGGLSVQQHLGPFDHKRILCGHHNQLHPRLQAQPLPDLRGQLDSPSRENLRDGYDWIVRQRTVDCRQRSSFIMLIPTIDGWLAEPLPLDWLEPLRIPARKCYRTLGSRAESGPIPTLVSVKGSYPNYRHAPNSNHFRPGPLVTEHFRVQPFFPDRLLHLERRQLGSMKSLNI